MRENSLLIGLFGRLEVDRGLEVNRDFLEVFFGEKITTIDENCQSDQKTCPNRHFLVVSSSFWHFYLLVGINMITHVVATFGKAVCDFFSQSSANVTDATSNQKWAGWA